MPYRIERSIEAEAIVFALCGEVDDEHTERLQELLDIEKQSERRRRILLNLEDVTLVRREGVEFLARLEASGVGIVNCPQYIRSWISAERSVVLRKR